jgi:hypothetical protein
MLKYIENIELIIRKRSKHLFSTIQDFPIISAISFITVVFLLSAIFDNLAKAFAAIGTISAVIWALYHQEIKHFIDRPELQINNIQLDYPYFHAVFQHPFDVDYYINIPLINNGKRTAKYCTPILFSIFKKDSDDEWKQIQNWLPRPLYWAVDEREFEDVVIEDASQTLKRKIARVERNIVPNRPYFFNLGMFDVGKDMLSPCQFVLLTLPPIKEQRDIYSEGHYCYELKVIGEEIEPLIKYIYLQWRWDCKPPMTTRPEIIIWKIEDNPPKV